MNELSDLRTEALGLEIAQRLKAPTALPKDPAPRCLEASGTPVLGESAAIHETVSETVHMQQLHWSGDTLHGPLALTTFTTVFLRGRISE